MVSSQEDRVRRQHVVERAAQQRGGDACRLSLALSCVALRRAISLPCSSCQRLRRSAFLPAVCPAFFSAAVEQPQRLRDVAFEINVGLHGLIDHVLLERVFADRNDLRVRRRVARRIPRHAALDQQREVGLLVDRRDVGAEMQRMRFREIGIGRGAAFDHRNGHQLGELDQRRDRLRIAAGAFDDDDRALGLRDQRGDALDVLRQRLASSAAPACRGAASAASSRASSFRPAR